MQALGVLLAEMGQPHDARACYRKAVNFDPKDLYNWQAWAVLEGRLGNNEEAREIFQRGVRANSNSRNLVQLWQVCLILSVASLPVGWVQHIARLGLPGLPIASQYRVNIARPLQGTAHAMHAPHDSAAMHY
jgi:tetratricopeptide (TPR) repeat protein